jgi:beta-glucanase (GH16 family)
MGTSNRRLAVLGAFAVLLAGSVAVGAVRGLAGDDGSSAVRPLGPPGAAAPVAPGSDDADAPQPAGAGGGWKIMFGDEFDGPALDTGRWADTSSAEADEGRGNKGNQQLEWNRAANCVLTDGHLAMTARREPVTSAAGTRYEWTSCLLSTAPSYTFQYGFIEERAILPEPRGFWPAFWTWQAAGVDKHVETDVYEFHSGNRDELLLTQQSAPEDACAWRPRFDPTADWHTYGASIEPSGTVWYVDGVEVCRTRATSDGVTNIISNLAVHADDPPAPGTDEAVKRVDYIRAWQRA